MATQLRVRLGEWNAAGNTEPLPAQEFVVSKIFIHPSFNPNNLMNDVAVLRLAVPVTLGQLPTITTACLPVSSYVGQRYGSSDGYLFNSQTLWTQKMPPKA